LNPVQAEEDLIASIDELDFCRTPESDDFLTWERAVVKLSVGTPVLPSTNEHAALAWPLLQPGLRPLTQISRLPRIAFVLRLLLGYSIEACAQTLGIEESEIPRALAEAAVQLQQATAPILTPNLVNSRAAQQ
jgi:DNA-directed RNA polymerase specialized sigma24 family protein